ncbi:MAG: ABC transporter permease [Anaerolineales bacterium]
MRAIFSLLYKELSYHRVYPLDLISLAISPFFIVAPFVFVAKAHNENLQLAVALGLIVWYWLSMFFWGVGYGVRDEVEEGVIESLLATPAPIRTLLAAKAIDTLLINLYITAALVVLLWLLAGVPFRLDWARFFLLFIVSNLALASLSFVYAAFVLVARQAAFAGNLFQEAVGILSGMTAPVSILPKAIRWLSMLIPLTYAIEGARKVAVGQFPYGEITILLIFSAVLLLFGAFFVQKAERYLRLTGTTGEY